MSSSTKTQFGEKFWAFMALGLGVLLLASLAVFFTPSDDKAFRILDAAMGGVLLALGSAANALFRVSQKDTEDAVAGRLAAETAHTLSQKTDPPTGEARESIEEGLGQQPPPKPELPPLPPIR